MKKLSIQTRLVLFHTAAMTLVVALVLGLLFSLSSQEILTSAQATLEERVSQGVEEVEYTQGRLEFDSELLSLENGVYLSVYQPGDSSMLYGRLPYGFAYTLPLSDGELRTVTAGGTEYSVLDLQFPVEGYGTLVMRGVVSLTAAERDFRATLRLALVLLPLLALAPRLHHRYAGRTFYALWLLLAVRLVLPVQLTLPEPAVTVEAPSGSLSYTVQKIER